jgi:integrase
VTAADRDLPQLTGVKMGVGRRSLAVGTMGVIRVYRVAHGYRARVLVRDPDGRVRDIERLGLSRSAAERALKEAFRDRAHADAGTDITPDTRVRVLAETWFASLEGQSPTTRQSYRNRVDKQILPALGDLRVRELSIGTVDRFLQTVRKQNGAAMAKMTRSVLSGICGLAARHDALDRNPVRDANVITQPRKAVPKSLTVKEVRQLRALMTYDDEAVERDLPEFVSFMLASGLRIGEASAVTWAALDLDAGTVEVRGTVVRLTGRGLILMPTTKSTAGMRTLALPSWCLEMLRARADRRRAHSTKEDPVFPAPKGGLRDPSNTQADLKDSLKWCGLPWVTSHVFRKTTATLLDDAGLSARAIADQLGHAQPSLTQNVYMGRKIASIKAAGVLEQFG